MNSQNTLDKISVVITEKIGTPISIVIHTFFFVGIFALELFGFSIDQILLILTTVVSLEAIYLSIFIQMTVNRNTQSLQAVEENIDEIQEDVDEIQENVDELQENVEEISEEDKEEEENQQTLEDIEKGLQKLLKEVELLKGLHSKTSHG